MRKTDFRLLSRFAPAYATKNGHIVYIDCKGLFGSKDLTFALNQNSDIGILIAPNGYGKTTILSLLEGILNFASVASRSRSEGKIDLSAEPQLLRSLRKITRTPFTVFSIVVATETGYKVQSMSVLRSKRQLYERERSRFFCCADDFSYCFAEALIDSPDPDQALIQLTIRKVIDSVEAKYQSTEPLPFAVDGVLFYDLRDEPPAFDCSVLKVEANKFETSDSEEFFHEVLTALERHGYFDSQLSEKLVEKGSIGDRYSLPLFDAVKSWERLPFFFFPYHHGINECDKAHPFSEEISPFNYPREMGELAKLSLWSFVRFCGFYNQYDRRLFAEDAKSLLSTLRNLGDCIARGSITDYGFLYSIVSCNQRIAKEELVSKEVGREGFSAGKTWLPLLREVGRLALKLPDKAFDRWIDLVIKHADDAFSEERWLAEDHDVPISFDEFCPVYLGQKFWYRPMAAPKVNRTAFVITGYEEIPLSDESKEIYRVDQYGERLYFFFDYLRSLFLFEDSFNSVTGLRLGKYDSNAHDFAIDKATGDDELTRLLGKRLITRNLMSSGERAVLSTLSSCSVFRKQQDVFYFFGGGLREKYGSGSRFRKDSMRLVLIDEPENSLHIAWQELLLGSIQRTIDVHPVQLIVATHSPSIISDLSHCLMEELVDDE